MIADVGSGVAVAMPGRAALDITRALAVPGWMSPDELTWLAAQAQDAQVVVEVGSWKGRSTMALADHCLGTVYAIDQWAGDCLTDTGRVHPLKTDVSAAFRTHLRWHLKTGRVKALRLPSSRALARLARQIGRVADLVFIDGDHRYSGVTSDIAAARPLLKPGGVLCGHDYTNADWPGVATAVTEAFGGAHQLVDSIWWVRP